MKSRTLAIAYKGIRGSKKILTRYNETLDFKKQFFGFAKKKINNVYIHMFMGWCYHLCIIFHKMLHTYGSDEVSDGHTKFVTIV